MMSNLHITTRTGGAGMAPESVISNMIVLRTGWANATSKTMVNGHVMWYAGGTGRAPTSAVTKR